MFDGNLVSHNRPGRDRPERHGRLQIHDAVRLGLLLAVLLGLATLTAAVPALTPSYVLPGLGAAHGDLSRVMFLPW